MVDKRVILDIYVLCPEYLYNFSLKYFVLHCGTNLVLYIICSYIHTTEILCYQPF